MVRLTKIYTKTGDNGTTGLATGARVPKDDLCVEAYGTVDEANAAVGVVIAIATCSANKVARSPVPASPLATGATPDRPAQIAAALRAIQHDLFDLGADLSTPIAPGEAAGSKLRIIASQTAKLEGLIDEHNGRLKPLNSFVLPGGNELSAALNVARTVVRRAERIAVTLRRERGEEVSTEAIKYLNRLSDLLFVLGRVANNDGAMDVLWKPGANR